MSVYYVLSLYSYYRIYRFYSVCFFQLGKSCVEVLSVCFVEYEHERELVLVLFFAFRSLYH